MLTTVKSIILQGLKGIIVNVEVDSSPGIPSWEIIGLPDTSIKEAKERVRTALKNIGIYLKSKKIIINLSPANIRKEGAILDLPMAMGILGNIGIIDSLSFKNILFIGELSLTGKLNKVKGVLPMCIEAKKYGIKEIFLPLENAKEASLVNGINIYGVESIREIILHINKEIKINPYKNEKICLKQGEYQIDFSEVKGQKYAKRALEVTAAGGHNCLMIGSPGTGKTMMAQRLITILPDLTFEESLEITKISSILGDNNELFNIKRNFRMPHSTITPASLIGGGRYPKPGEISMAHLGVLFLDELPEFSKQTLEMLRGPIEEKNINLTRNMINVEYPCNFILIASMNPCPCGYYGTQDKECICSETQIKKYRNKISGPLLDRIDIHIEVFNEKNSEYQYTENEKSAEIRKRVNIARKVQTERYKKYNVYSNSELSPKLISIFCKLNNESEKILNKAMDRLKLSGRAYSKILKVARTIADLEESENIKKEHLIEAIQYRSLDRK